MKIDRNLKIGIIGGLIAAMLFFYFLNPILSIFGKICISVGSKIYSVYIDRLFEKLALGEAFDSAFGLTILILSLFCGILVGFNIVVTRRKRSLLLKKPSKEKIKEKPLFKKFKKLFIYGILNTLLLIIMTMWLIWGQHFQLKTITSFRQHMVAVAPYISEDEEEVIWSQWTQMRSKKDYEKIYEILNNLAERNHIKLPENYVYTLKRL